MRLTLSSSHFRGGKPSKLAYGNVLCDTAGQSCSAWKEEKSMHVSFFYPLILFSVSASVRVPPVTLVCPQEAETRKAVSGNISTNLPGRIRDLLFARILPRDVYFVIAAAGGGRDGGGWPCGTKENRGRRKTLTRGRHRMEHGRPAQSCRGLRPRNNTHDIRAHAFTRLS